MALSDAEVAAVFERRTEGRRKSEEAKRLREATFPARTASRHGRRPMEGDVGIFAALFRATGVSGKAFPVTEDGSKCVLCQQDLDHAAAQRLKTV